VITFAAEPETVGTSKSFGVSALDDLVRRVESEYLEMPGLNLTMPQAERLWGLDRSTCTVILEALIDRQVLKRTNVGTYLRWSPG
jgi:hypothetical protein